VEAVKSKKMAPLDFTFFVPKGYGADGKLPNVEETPDPARAFTAQFNRGKIKWPET
jgi:hypothetical protein